MATAHIICHKPSKKALLGIISGRYRMGKNFLLQELVEQHGGFYFGATAATEAESLRQFGAEIARFSGISAPLAFAHWDTAISYLFTIALPEKRSKPLLVVIDEFPYLAKVSPILPSLLQREIDAFQRRESTMRLLLCGSAMSVMGGLLGGTAPLRGRAQLEIIIKPFGFRDAATFWNVNDQPKLAAQLFLIMGGTPAYLKQFLDNDAPTSLADFDDWLCRTVLSPLSPLFREARYLLAEETEIRDTALYHSVLAAVAEGNRTRGVIANYIGRKSVDISHPLTMLEDCYLLVRETDIFRTVKSHRITEPLINFLRVSHAPRVASFGSRTCSASMDSNGAAIRGSGGRTAI